jgi:hypothetical protein
MPDTKDLWYIRLPDGRVLRSTDVSRIRRQIAAGRLPPGTHVRRPEGDWRDIERVEELADARPASLNGSQQPATIASRLDPARLHLAGVRGVLEELLGALDSTAVPNKLWAAALAGVLLGGLAALSQLPLFTFTLWLPGPGWLLALAALVVWSWLVVVLSKMTFTEVSRLRPARWRDGLEGSISATLHLSIVQGILIALLGGAIIALRALPGWLLTLGPSDNLALQAGAQTAAVVGMGLELLIWPLFALLLPMGALIAVESGSFLSALGQWLALVWKKGRRLLLAEGLAVGLCGVIAVPLALVGAAVLTRFDGTEFSLAVSIARSVLLGLLASGVLAYLVVANVFIYLNLRYEEPD